MSRNVQRLNTKGAIEHFAEGIDWFTKRLGPPPWSDEHRAWIHQLAEGFYNARLANRAIADELSRKGETDLADFCRELNLGEDVLETLLWGICLGARGCFERAVSTNELTDIRGELGYQTLGSVRDLLKELGPTYLRLIAAPRPVAPPPPAPAAQCSASDSSSDDYTSGGALPGGGVALDERLSFLPPLVQRAILDVAEALRSPEGGALLLGPRVVAWSGLPDREELARRIATHFGLSGSLEKAWPKLEAQVGLPRLLMAFAELLADEQCPVGERFQVAARAPFRYFVTTGPDRHLEWALSDARRKTAIIASDSAHAIIRPGHVPVLKLYGCVSTPNTLRVPWAPPPVGFGESTRGRWSVRIIVAIGFEGHDTLLAQLREELLLSSRREVELLRIEEGGGAHELSPADKRVGARTAEEVARILGVLAGLDLAEQAQLARRSLSRANPFPGLSPYAAGAHLFLGRDAEVKELLERLESLPRITTFFGPSGSGKSSFFAAGFVPAARARGHRCAVARLLPGCSVLAQLASAAGARTGTTPSVEELAEALDRARGGARLVLILDQFEQIFYQPFESDVPRHVLCEVVPALVARLGGALWVFLVVRSDDFYHFERFRDQVNLDGVFHRCERVDALTAEGAAAVVTQLFRRSDYALGAGCARALIQRATAEGRDRPYLPYLQLLGNRFFEQLELRHLHQRGFGQAIAIDEETFVEWAGSGDLFSEYLRATVLSLLHVDEDRALLFRLFELLVEGDRRRSLNAQQIRDRFAHPERVGFLLVNLASRRLVRFEDGIDAYELVHDSLVGPLRNYLDEHRSDFSASELLAAARRLLSGATVSPAFRGHVVLHCLRQGLPVAWAERGLADPMMFYAELSRQTLPEDCKLVWERLARLCDRTGRLPVPLDTGDLREALLGAAEERTAVATARLLRRRELPAEDIRTLRAWLGDIGSGDPHTALARCWARAFGEVLDLLIDAGALDIDNFLTGATAYFQCDEPTAAAAFSRVLQAAVSGKLDVSRVVSRIRAELELKQTGGPPDRFRGVVEALVVLETDSRVFDEALQEALRALRRAPGEWALRVSVLLCRKLLMRYPEFVYSRLDPLLSDLAPLDVGLTAARTLGLATRKPDDLVDLIRRFETVSAAEHRALLFEAIFWSLARLTPAQARLIDPSSAALAAVAATDPVMIQRLVDGLDAESWAETGARSLEDVAPEVRPLLVYATARQIHMTGASASPRAVWLIRAFQLLCAVVGREAAGLAKEDDRDLLCRVSPSSATFEAEWDEAQGVIESLYRDDIGAGEHAQAMLRWLRARSLASADPALATLTESLLTWFAEVPDVVRALTRRSAPTFRVEITRTRAFLAIESELGRAEMASALLDAGLTSGELAATRDAMAALAHKDRARTVANRLRLASEVAAWAVEHAGHERSAEAELFLVWLLRHPPAVAPPGSTLGMWTGDVIRALVRLYSGQEAQLAGNLEADMMLDDQIRLQAYTAIARAAPDRGGPLLCSLLEGLLTPGQYKTIESEILLDALSTLGGCPPTAAALELLRRVDLGEAGADITGAAAAALVRLSSDVEDQVRALGFAQKHVSASARIAAGLDSVPA